MFNVNDTYGELNDTYRQTELLIRRPHASSAADL